MMEPTTAYRSSFSKHCRRGPDTRTTSATTPGGGIDSNAWSTRSNCLVVLGKLRAEWGFSPDPREETGFVEPPTSLSAAVVVDAQELQHLSPSRVQKAVQVRERVRTARAATTSAERSGAPSERGDNASSSIVTKSTKESKSRVDDSDWE
ncbi:hypothetical protein ACM66B_002428 [Microbotryomycetes sp. NB124-2]